MHTNLWPQTLKQRDYLGEAEGKKILRKRNKI
jgi:hypothetical protein